MELFSNKKGQTTLNNLQTGIMGLVFVAVILAAGALALNAFQDDLTNRQACTNATHIFNISHAQCCDPDTADSQTTYSCTGVNSSGPTTTLNTTQEGLQGTSNATSFLSTIGTLIGVAALISIVVGAFLFARR